jgi:hypothetical protein
MDPDFFRVKPPLKIALAVVLAALPASAWAVQGKTLSDRISLESRAGISIAADRVDIVVEASPARTLGYEVDFVPASRGVFSQKPSQEAYDKSTAAFDRKTGVLSIHAEEGVLARIRVSVPVDRTLGLKMENGRASIGARSGRTTVEMGNGMLSFDASQVPASSCVAARVDHGFILGGRSGSCKESTASLHLKNGILKVF